MTHRDKTARFLTELSQAVISLDQAAAWGKWAVRCGAGGSKRISWPPATGFTVCDFLVEGSTRPSTFSDFLWVAVVPSLWVVVAAVGAHLVAGVVFLCGGAGVFAAPVDAFAAVGAGEAAGDAGVEVSSRHDQLVFACGAVGSVCGVWVAGVAEGECVSVVAAGSCCGDACGVVVGVLSGVFDSGVAAGVSAGAGVAGWPVIGGRSLTMRGRRVGWVWGGGFLRGSGT